MNFPLSRQWMVDNEVNLDNENPKVKSGVTFSDGDGTVSVLSLGTMCVDGWKKKIYNPSGVRTTFHCLCYLAPIQPPSDSFVCHPFLFLIKFALSQIPVLTHEIEHRPASFDIRGGSTTADRK